MRNGCKVENFLEGCLDSIPSPSPSVKIQILAGKGVKAKHCAGCCQLTFEYKKFVDNAQHVLPIHFMQTFPPIIWIFTEGEGDEIFFYFNNIVFKSCCIKWNQFKQTVLICLVIRSKNIKRIRNWLLESSEYLPGISNLRCAWIRCYYAIP